ncbi:hypothetical protein FHY30_003832 [Xanthomonas arboricola]|uniref:hypothetical protein n=1 Tax=Xanthomonas campestris TaxID=339 RepID=UPI002166DD0B|nr:hypothetical protein [Xanthomonas campestris]MCS3848997.1 hypothetical protein [Xanthomonas campestris]MCW2005008.1 hypothetical protein [Xanthomonas campestris]
MKAAKVRVSNRVKVNHKLRALVLVAGCTFALNTQAQLVTWDPGNWFENFSQQFQAAAQYLKDNAHDSAEVSQWGKQIAQWGKQIAYWNSTLAKYNPQNFTSLLPGGVKLERVDDNYMVAELCGSDAPSIFSIAGLKEIVVSKIQAAMKVEDLAAEQAKTCAFIQMLKNKRHNESIDFIEQTSPAMQQDLVTLAAMRMVRFEPGEMSSTMYDLDAMASRMSVMMYSWEVRNKAYDSYIVLMQDKQNALARKSLKGKETLMGSVVKNLALRAALDNEQVK